MPARRMDTRGLKVTNKGAALLMVIWVVMLLTVIAGEFCYSIRTQANITRNLKESTQAYYIALAGLNTAIFKLVEQQVMPRTAELTDEAKEKEEESLPLRVNTKVPPMPFGEGEFMLRIDNEAGKININRAEAGGLRLMLSGFDLDEEEKDTIVDSILDWRDADNLHRAKGAEDDYYASLPEPYECRDGYFESIDELLLVKGVTPDIFYNGLEDMITVFLTKTKKTGKQKARPEGYALNINAISPRLWASLPGITEEAIDAVTEYRKEKDFRSVAELREVVGPDVYKAVSRYLTVETLPYYTVRSMGTVSGGQTREGVEALIHLDIRAAKKYRVVQWKDSVFHHTPRDDSSFSRWVSKQGD